MEQICSFFGGKKGRTVKGISCIVSILVVCAAVGIFFRSVAIGAEAAETVFSTTKEEEEAKAYQDFYDRGYNKAEKENHVSNEITIFIDKIKEVAKLEVLKVRDVEFVAENAEDNEENITSWLEVTGEGIFTVDLTAGEVLVDRKRQYVIVRVPEPKLTEYAVDHDSIQILKWDNDWRNDSIAKGEALAQKNMAEADALIKKEFTSNQRYYQAAKASAENLIVNFVKELNSHLPELKVIVEFME